MSGGQEPPHAEGDSLYDIMGVDKEATDEEIKKAYRKLALKYHPDKNVGDETATAKFQVIVRAKTILLNPKKRKMYDKYGDMGVKFTEDMGDDAVDLLLKIDTWWCKLLCGFCGIITLCYCCCCACCCCAPCRRGKSPDEYEERPEAEEDDVITHEPTSNYHSFDDNTGEQVPSDKTPIVHGPP